MKSQAMPSLAGLIGLGAVTLLVAGLLGWLVMTLQPAGGGGASSANGQPAIGGAFQLIDQNGKAVDQSILQGHWSLVFFGYVSCPDICPATLQTIEAAKEKLGHKADGLQVVFITVDPARDTPAQLKAWLDQPGFPKPVTALTGTPAQIAAAAKAYKVFYKREGPAKGDAYQMAHTAAIYLMDPKGQFNLPLTYEQGPQKLADQIGAAVK
jgi:protein SCO1/2